MNTMTRPIGGNNPQFRRNPCCGDTLPLILTSEKGTT